MMTISMVSSIASMESISKAGYAPEISQAIQHLLCGVTASAEIDSGSSVSNHGLLFGMLCTWSQLVIV